MRNEDLEARLRHHAQDFDDEVPRRPDFERRVIARASAQPEPVVKRPTMFRDLALAALVVLLVGSLGFGVVQLRSLRQAATVKSPGPSASASITPTATPAATLAPTLSYTPGVRVPAGPIAIGSAFTATPFKMVTPLRGWAVGPPGKDRDQPHDGVLITEDGGAHWRNVTPPGFSGWTDRTMFFLDVTHAWVAVTPHVVAHPAATPATITVFRTSDGANSWQSATFQIADGSPSQLEFIDSEHGWMILQVNNGLAIYRTIDGGTHWTPESLSTRTGPKATAPPGTLPQTYAFGPNARNELACDLDTSALVFRDAFTGWAAGNCRGSAPTRYLYVTHDAGSTWQPQLLPSLPDLPACPCYVRTSVPAFTSSRDASFMVSFSTEVWKCQTQGAGTACSIESTPVTAMLYATHDGGTTWAPHVLPGVAAFGAEPAFIDGRNGWYGASILKVAPSYVGETMFDKLYITHDGGSTWSPVGAGAGFDGGRIAFLNSRVGWAQSLASLLVTSDGGRTWQPLNAVVTG